MPQPIKRPALRDYVLQDTTERVGDKMVHTRITEHSAIVYFHEIMAATKVVEDDRQGAPWEDCDGWEHEVIKDPDEKEPWCAHWDQVCKSPAVFRQPERNGGWCMIHIDRATTVEWIGKYDHNQGVPRQVYEERLAKVRRDAIETLVRWHADGYFWRGVVCEFLDEDASLWGIQVEDDTEDDPYLQEIIEEIALEVATALETAGYTILNKPEREDRGRNYKQKCLRQRIAQRLGFTCVEDYRAWLTRI